MKKIITNLFILATITLNGQKQFEFEGFWEIQKWYVKITKVSDSHYQGVSTKKKNGLTQQAFEYDPHFSIEIVKDRKGWQLFEHRTNGSINSHKIKINIRKPDEFKAKGIFGNYKRVPTPERSVSDFANKYPKMKKIYDKVNQLCKESNESNNSSTDIQGMWSMSSEIGEHVSELAIIESDDEYYSCVIEDFNFTENEGGNLSTILKFKPTAYKPVYLVEFYIPEIGEYIGSKAKVTDNAYMEFSIKLSKEILNKIDDVYSGGFNEIKQSTTLDFSLIRIGVPAGDSPQPNTSSNGELVPKGYGTGFVLNKEGLFATNHHVIEGCKELGVFFPHNDEIKDNIIPLTVESKDSNNDLAILKLNNVDGINLENLYGFDTNHRVGEEVFVIGYPRPSLQGINLKITNGLINSNTGIKDNYSTMQISVPIQPGNSGSPLFNADGNVVGVVSSTLNPNYTYKQSKSLPQNVNYAVKAAILSTMTSLNNDKHKSKLTYADYFEMYKNYIGIVVCY